MTIEQITDHAERQKARLPRHLDSAENFNLLLDTLAARYQEIETQGFKLLDERYLSVAVGAQLDGIGQILDLEREAGQTDTSYRAALTGVTGSLALSGQIEVLIDAYIRLTDAQFLTVTEYYPATVQLVAHTETDITPEEGESIVIAMNDVKAAGVALELLYALAFDDFYLDSVANVDANGTGPLDPLHGLGSAAGGIWTIQTNPATTFIGGVANNGALFVAVGINDGTDALVLRSADNGVTWVEQTNPKNLRMTSVWYGDGLFVGVGFAESPGDSYIISSSDGISWTEQTNPQKFALNDVIYDGVVWITAGSQTGSGAYLITSPDAVVWTQKTVPSNETIFGLATNGPRLVAVGDILPSLVSYIITSDDHGETWTERTNPGTERLQKVAWNGSVFCAVTAGGEVLTSPDGETWTSYATGVGNNLVDITVAEGSFYVTTSSNLILNSDDNGETWSQTVVAGVSSIAGIDYNSSTNTLCGVGLDIITSSVENEGGRLSKLITTIPL